MIFLHGEKDELKKTSWARLLTMLIPFLIAGALVLAGLGVGLFFLIRHLTQKNRSA